MLDYFLPPDETSKQQPLDQIITNAIKANCKKRLMEDVLFHLSQGKSDIANSVYLLDVSRR